LYIPDESVCFTSKQKGRIKFLLRLPQGQKPIPTRQVIVDGDVVLEFRCASANGKTVQDLLPPSVHPSGRKYEWITDVEVASMPTLPDDWLAVWLGLEEPPAPEKQTQNIFENVPDHIKRLGPCELTQRLTGYGQSDKPSLRLIEQECEQVSEAMRTGGASRAEPLWRADIGLIKHTDGGDFACHQASSKHPSYSHDETERKIQDYGAGPTTCQHYQNLNPGPCSACKHCGHIKSPIVLGRQTSIVEPGDNPPDPAHLRARKPFTLVSAGSLLSRPVPPRDFLLLDFLPKNIIGGLVAPGGTGKSMLAMHIGVALSGGTSLFARYLAPRPGVVVYLSGEDDEYEMHRRLSRIVSAESTATQERVKKNLYLLDRSEQFDLFTKRDGVGEAEITQVVADLASAIREQTDSDLALLIVDPAARFRGGEENSASDVNRFIQALYRLREMLGCSVLVLHHVNKGARVNGASQNNARGSSAFADGVRLMYELNPSDQMPSVLQLSCVKSNYGKRPDPITLLQQPDGTLAPSTHSSQDMRHRTVLKELQGANLTKQQFKSNFGGKDKKLGMSDREIREMLTDLETRGLIEVKERRPIKVTDAGERLLNAS
jgi:Mn-dependent DtxR family transcriptional regulator